jgi:AhpD family alkylhydroperoxidase
MQLWLDFGNAILRSGLDECLMELVKTRASQINGCAVCLHMHTVSAWRDGGASLTLVSEARAPR